MIAALCLIVNEDHDENAFSAAVIASFSSLLLHRGTLPITSPVLGDTISTNDLVLLSTNLPSMKFFIVAIFKDVNDFDTIDLNDNIGNDDDNDIIKQSNMINVNIIK